MIDRLKRLRNWQIFIVAIIIGFFLMLGWIIVDDIQRKLLLSSWSLTNEISVTGQINKAKLLSARGQGFVSIIDLRPDGEDEDEPDSASIEKAAALLGLQFHYVPVPHGEIPEAAVEGLRQALDDSPRPVLLYCRSGRRAVRTWALMEASHTNGLSETDIQKAAVYAAQDIKDLIPDIERRIASRSTGGRT